MAKNFVGLLFFRTTGQQARDLGVLRRLRDQVKINSKKRRRR